jgi:hypothetical protein
VRRSDAVDQIPVDRVVHACTAVHVCLVPERAGLGDQAGPGQCPAHRQLAKYGVIGLPALATMSTGTLLWIVVVGSIGRVGQNAQGVML